MNISIKATGLELTPSLKVYIEKKLVPMERYIKRFDMEGMAELRLEVARITRHHKHGDVFMAEANLSLPKKMLRAVERMDDVRKAIDEMKRTLKMEIDKYKTVMNERPIRERKKQS